MKTESKDVLMGFEVPTDVLKGIIGTEIVYEDLTDLSLAFPLKGAATVSLTMVLKREHAMQLRDLIRASNNKSESDRICEAIAKGPVLT